jgi:glycosyltransferase involved in cell wall biosynthesis
MAPYCRTYKLQKDDKINCKVCIINYDSSVCDQITEGKIYMVFHGDYSHEAYTTYPEFNEKITGYIVLTDYLKKVVKDKFGITAKRVYNPLTVDKDKPLVLLSATRLSEIKGKDRMIALGEALNKAKVNYIWYVYTNDERVINNPNIIYMKPRTDIDRIMNTVDYVVQLSDTEALSYTINEALYRDIPVIVTPLPYLEEIGVKDGENCYIVKFDCSNVEEVAKKIKTKPKFKFEKLKDDYDKILAKGKNQYQEDLKTMKQVRLIIPDFNDLETKDYRLQNDTWLTTKLRAEYLESLGYVEIL